MRRVGAVLLLIWAALLFQPDNCSEAAEVAPLRFDELGAGLPAARHAPNVVLLFPSPPDAAASDVSLGEGKVASSDNRVCSVFVQSR